MKKRNFQRLYFIILAVQIIISPILLKAQLLYEEPSEVPQTYFEVPNTNIKIIPPAHFHFMEQISGFLHVGTSSSVQIQEISGTSYPMIVQGLTEAHFVSQGVRLLSKENITTYEGTGGVLFTVAFKVEDIEFERYMLFTGDYNNTIWINANYPVIMKDILGVVLRESLLTAKFIN